MQKGNILPSERAFAFKLKLEATKGQGVRTDLPRVDKIVAEQVGSSRNKLQRYIHLTGLICEILSMVDEKKIAINRAVELPYLKKRNRRICLRSWKCCTGYSPIFTGIAIKPVSDLRDYNKVLKECKNGEPVYLTKMGTESLFC